jgi:chromate transporter
VITVIIALFYVQNQELPWLQSVFYGIGACVIGIIAVSSGRLLKKNLKKDYLLWMIAIVNASLTAITHSEWLTVMLGSGLIVYFWRNHKQSSSKVSMFGLIPLHFLYGNSGNSETLKDLFLFFIKAGSVVFGSGLAIIPFLHSGVVEQYRWLTEQQFLDAVAVAMITPGPVVITVAFIGYLVSGFLGASLASLGVFIPCYLLVVGPAPFFQKFSKNKKIKDLVDGFTAAAIGALAGAVIILGHLNLKDIPTWLICIISLFIVLKIKKIPEPLLILISGLVGLLLKGA